MQIYVMRHGQTAMNTQHKLQGRTDTQLNETGKEQAREAGKRLKMRGICPNIIFCSPLKRVQQTAEEALQIKREKMHIDPRLIEMSFGVCEGECVDNLSEDFRYHFFEEPETYPVPKGGESFHQVVERTGCFLEDLKTRKMETCLSEEEKKIPEEERVIMVASHGAAIHAMLHYILKTKLNDFWKIQVDNCAVFKITLPDGENAGSVEMIS